MASRRRLRAQLLATPTFAVAALSQAHALYTGRAPPADAVYTPHPYFLMAFFVLQVGVQGYWIAQMFGPPARESSPALLSPLDGPDALRAVGTERECEPAQMAYIPFYALGNVCIVGSTLAWAYEYPIFAQLFIACTTAAHLYFVLFALRASGKLERTRRNRLTHLVAKTGAGVAVLYLWRAWGAANLGSSRPAAQQQAHCGVLFLLLAFASGPDPTLSATLSLDLAALAAGDTTEGWRFAFLCIMGLLLVVALCDCMLAWRRRHASPPRALAGRVGRGGVGAA